jgi:nucleotide-binding universal stress UspA family protein
VIIPVDIDPSVLSEIDGLPGPIREQLVTSGDIERLAASLMSKAEAYLSDVAESFKRAGVSDVTVQALQGRGAEHILREGEADTPTLIAISTHGRHGITHWVLGSTSDKVIQAARNPMLVFRPRAGAQAQAEAKVTTVIVPLDGSTIAEQALPHAVNLAKSLDTRIMLVRALPSSADLYRFIGYFYIPPPTLSLDMEAEAMRYLEETGDKLRNQGVTQVDRMLLHGDPAASIVDLAARDTDSLVVMTTHGRSGIGRWMLGSVSDRVIRTSENPVLVIRATPEEREDA